MATFDPCNMPQEGTPTTINLLDENQVRALAGYRPQPEQYPDFVMTGEIKRFERKFFSDRIHLFDGEEVEIWGFEGEDGRRGLPSPMIRVNQGDVAQVTLHASKKSHTIHHHGIEPDPRNDGVGHSSFEVTGSYTYQWVASNAGTYFYHCHVNTALHVQMGMFGPLVIDPPEGRNPNGRSRPYVGAPEEFWYDVEALLVGHEIDPRWHTLGHAAGLCGEDVGLNDFQPMYHMINGIAQEPGGPPIDSPNVAVTAKVGDRILVRSVNGGYFPQTWLFVNIETGEPLVPLAIASDGRPFRVDPHDTRSDPSPIPFEGFPQSPAERWDLLLTPPPVPATYVVTVLFHQWTNLENIAGVAQTTITVEGDPVPPTGEGPGSTTGGTSAPPSVDAPTPNTSTSTSSGPSITSGPGPGGTGTTGSGGTGTTGSGSSGTGRWRRGYPRSRRRRGGAF